MDSKYQRNQEALLHSMSQIKLVQHAFRAFHCLCVVYPNICAGVRIISSRQTKLQLQLAFQGWSDNAYPNRDDTNPAISVISGVSAATEPANIDQSELRPVRLFHNDDENQETIVKGRQEHINASMCQMEGVRMHKRVTSDFRM